MPQTYEARIKWVLITCAGFLAGSLGVFVSILSVIVSPLLSAFLTPKPILIGEGKTSVTSRLQLPPEKIRLRHFRRPPSDKSSSFSSNTLSSTTTTHSALLVSNKGRRSPSPNGTRFPEDIGNPPESPALSQPSIVSSVSTPSSPPKAQKNGIRTYLGIRKRSTILDEPTPEETIPVTDNSEINQDKGPREKFDQAEIIVSPPTPSSSVFLYSASGPFFEDVSTTSKPAARFVKSHSKRHSLSAACPRKRRSSKRSPTSPILKSSSPITTPMAGSKWNIGTRAAQRKKRKSLRIDPPLRSPTLPVLIESGDGVGCQAIYEEPIGIAQPPTSNLPLTPARQGPVRTRPYEAPYFFPTPGSLEAIGYVERVREERRSAPVYPEPTSARRKKSPGRSSTMSILDQDGIPGKSKLRGESSHYQNPGKKSSKSAGTKTDPSTATASDFGLRPRTPTIHRKSSAPAQLSSFNTTPPNETTASTTPPRLQTQRQRSLAIMRMLGKH